MKAHTGNTNLTRRDFLIGSGVVGLGAAMALLFGCSSDNTSSSSTTSITGSTGTSDLAIDMSAWSYDSDNKIYYQIGVPYCSAPATTDYESMGIYVPAAYLTGKKNSDGSTYTCTVNTSKKKGGFTADTAPIVMPINTAGYSAQQAPSEYSADGITDYTDAGFIYVFAGCRGRENGDGYAGGAPWGVTDLKAAVRTLRLNAGTIPGSTDRIFTFGHSGGGAQSALVGATGDAPEYSAYLENIGAPTTDADGNQISDAVAGSMCWCPITCLDHADEAYEWNMGQFSSSGTRKDGTFTAALSDDMAESYATYINNLGLTDSKGSALTLEKSKKGIYLSGSYYDYVKDVVEQSLNNFLKDTTFPYTPSNDMMADMGAGGGGGGTGSKPSRNLSTGTASTGSSSSSGSTSSSSSASTASSRNGAPSGAPSGSAPSGTPPTGGKGISGSNSSAISSGTTYKTAKAYIAALNEDTTWVKYNADKNTATITSVGAFVKACKAPTKDVGAFDALDRSAGENDLFGTADDDSLHFDTTMSDLLQANSSEYAKLSNWDSAYPDDYTNDIAKTDSLGTTSEVRQNMYNPLYYLAASSSGYGTSTPAAHWRIRTGIEQGDTANTTEINLALAAQAASGVSDVDFATVWGKGHTTAERTGTSTKNFIKWVKKCVSA